MAQTMSAEVLLQKDDRIIWSEQVSSTLTDDLTVVEWDGGAGETGQTKRVWGVSPFILTK